MPRAALTEVDTSSAWPSRGAAVMGLPLPIALPTFFVLPVGLLQVWQMVRIEQGSRPNWILLTLAGVTSFALTAYLLVFGFWTR